MRAEHEGYFTAMMQVVFDFATTSAILHDEAMFVHMYYPYGQSLVVSYWRTF